MRWLPAVPLHPAHPPAVRVAVPLAAFQDDTDYYALRFEGTGRLYGQGALANLAGSRVCVVGLGGVGSWAVEALARAGVGSLTLMDPDEVCISNTNRQTNALQGTVGRSKARVLAERVAQINPECRVRVREEWFTLEEGHDVLAAEAADATAERAGGAGSFAVLDAIDSYVEKCAAVEACIRLGVHVAVPARGSHEAAVPLHSHGPRVRRAPQRPSSCAAPGAPRAPRRARAARRRVRRSRAAERPPAASPSGAPPPACHAGGGRVGGPLRPELRARL